ISAQHSFPTRRSSDLPDSSFQWSQTANHDTASGKVISIDLTSQTWRGTPWKHALKVYVPATVTYPDAMLLFITGGSNGGAPSAEIGRAHVLTPVTRSS